MLDVDFTSLSTELMTPPPHTTVIDVISAGQVSVPSIDSLHCLHNFIQGLELTGKCFRGQVDAVVSWFRLDLDGTRSLHTGPDAKDEGNSCWLASHAALSVWVAFCSGSHVLTLAK